MSSNNPAGRLLRLLETGQKKPEGKRASEVWAELLRAESGDFADVLRRLGIVQQLPYHVRDKISRIDDIDTELHLRWMPQVEKAFGSFQLRSPWKNFITHIDEPTLMALSFCNDRLSRQEEGGFNDEVVRDSIREAEEIRQLVHESNLEKSVRDFLSKHVSNIHHSLEEYPISGPEAIEEALQITIGSVTINQEIYHKSRETSIGIRFWKFVERLVLISTLVVNSITMLGGTTTLIESSSNPSTSDQQEEVETHDRAVFRDEEEDKLTGT